MSKRPIATIKAVTDLPARLYGGNAQKVEVSALDYTLHLDLSKLPESPAPTLNDGKWTVCWDEPSNTYKRVEFSHLPAGDGIPGEKGDQGVPGPQGPAGPKGDPGTSGDWNTLTNKPATFPPSTHTHTEYVAKAGDTMTGQLTVQSNVIATAGLYATGGTVTVYGYIGDLNQSVIYMNGAGTKFIYNDGTKVSFAGTPVNIAVTTASTSPTTGALTVAGGVGINGSVYAAGSLVAAANFGVGTTTLMGYTAQIRTGVDRNFVVTSASGNGVQLLSLNDGNNAYRSLDFTGSSFAFGPGNVAIAVTTASTSPTTGALTVAGGVGVGGALNVGSSITINKTIATNFNLIYGNLNGLALWRMDLGDNNGSNFSLNCFNDAGAYLSTPFTVNRLTGAVGMSSAVASTSPTTGALTVAGGVGVGGALNAGGDVTITKSSPVLTITSSDVTDPTLKFRRNNVDMQTLRSDASNFYITSNAGTAGVVLPNGNSAWAAVSDARLPYKKTAREMSVLGRLDGFQLYENEVNGRLELFVKAQEFNAGFPHLVVPGSGPDDYEPTGPADPKVWAVSYDRAGVAALQAVKELLAEVKALRARVAELED